MSSFIWEGGEGLFLSIGCKHLIGNSWILNRRSKVYFFKDERNENNCLFYEIFWNAFNPRNINVIKWAGLGGRGGGWDKLDDPKYSSSKSNEGV